MAKAWFEGNNIFVSLDVNTAPQNAIDVPDNTLPQDLVINNGVLRLKTDAEKLQEKKQQLLEELARTIQDYILQFYPFIKQQSDAVDVENANNYLLLQGIDITALRKDIMQETINNYPNFNTALTNILSKYNPTSNPDMTYWITQLLKASFRFYFIHLVKEEYYQLKQAIQNATTETQLPQIKLFTPLPLL